MTSLSDFSATRLLGGDEPFSNYAGQVALIVNVASQCGFTPQYESLEALYRRYRDKGFVILGFPCNQFGAQEAGDAQEIATFCSDNYDVTFPMFGKIEVNGVGTDPLYRWLKKEAPGVLGIEAIKWNFTKFLVSRGGKEVTRFAPTTKPADIAPEIERLL